MQPTPMRQRTGGAMHLVRALQPRSSIIAGARKGKAPLTPPEPQPQPAAGEQEDEGEAEDEEGADLQEEGEWAEGEEGEQGELGEDFDEEEEGGEMDDVDIVNAYFGIPGMVQFSRGENDLPRLFLKHPYCESGAEIYLHGAAVTQWLRPDGSDALALRPDADFSGTRPIESGVNIFFPQYRSGGVLDTGFANNMSWEVVAAGCDFMPFGDGFMRDPTDEEVEQALAEARQEQGLGEGEGEGPAAQEGGEEAGEGRARGEGGKASSSSTAQGGAGRQGGGQEAAERQGGEAEGRGPGEAESGSGGQAGEGEGEGEGEMSSPWEQEDPEGEEEEEEEEEEERDTYGGQVPKTSDLDPASQLFKRYMNLGLDPSPYVTLRLKDDEETRKQWPHKFELLYKITLMETDEFDKVEAGPEHETFSLESSATMISEAMQAKKELVEQAKDEQEGEQEADDGLYRDPRLTPSAIERNEDYSMPMDEQPRPNTAVEAASGKRDPEEDEVQVPLQLRLEVKVTNEDPEGSEPMQFEMGHLAHITTKDMKWFGDFIKVRGLGGANVVDYTDDRNPTLSLCQEDYINFWGQRIDATFIGAAEADVAITPGDGTHFELLAREGHRDVMLFHPGTLEESVKEDTEAARTWAGLGAGRVMTPVTLEPGEEWYSCFKLRFNNRVWKEPVWGDKSMYPLDPVPKAMMDNADDAGHSEEDAGAADVAEEPAMM